MAFDMDPGRFGEAGVRVAVTDDVCEDAMRALHQHDFYELTLVRRGSCEFFFGRSRVPMIPGDLFVIPPGSPHACRIPKSASLYHCLFRAELVSGGGQSLLSFSADAGAPLKTISEKRMQDIQAFEKESHAAGGSVPRGAGADEPHGLIHLSHAESDCLFFFFKSIAEEQAERRTGFAQMQQAYLTQLLIQLRRIHSMQFDSAPRQASWKQDMIDAVLAQIDGDLARSVDFEAIAQAQGITLSYFRTIFKGITGLPPTDYLNRVRVLRALELLQTSDVPISEVAAKVGVYDANYFSRLFKKVTGYPPRYFKSIPQDGGFL